MNLKAMNPATEITEDTEMAKLCNTGARGRKALAGFRCPVVLSL